MQFHYGEMVNCDGGICSGLTAYLVCLLVPWLNRWKVRRMGRLPSEIFIVLLPSTVFLIVLVVDVVSSLLLLLLLLLVMGTKGVFFWEFYSLVWGWRGSQDDWNVAVEMLRNFGVGTS